MTKPSEEFIDVHTLANRFEADLLMNALEQEGIDYALRSFEETPYDGLFVPQRGWGKILVSPEKASQARQIISSILKAGEAKTLYRDPAEIDPLLWERLRQADPEVISRNAQVRYDPETSAYVMPFLNCEYHCLPDQEYIDVVSSTPYYDPYFEFYLVVLYYLLEAQSEPVSGKWVSEKDLPGGMLFFQGPHQFPFDPLLKLFGSRPDIFRKAGKALGGTEVDGGDAAFTLRAFPRIPLLFILWEGDEEFGPALNIRFDSTVALHLRSLDIVWALVNVVCRHLRAAAEAVSDEEAIL